VKNRKSRQPTVDTVQQQAIIREREEANARLERQIAERKKGAVSREEYLAMKNAKDGEA
jgi:hypothetical protein